MKLEITDCEATEPGFYWLRVNKTLDLRIIARDNGMICIEAFVANALGSPIASMEVQQPGADPDDKLVAFALIDGIELAGYTAEAYSGRGSEGTECVAVLVDGTRVNNLTCDVSVALSTMFATALADQSDNSMISRAAAAARNWQTDRMGRCDTIVYWPTVHWPADRGGA